VLLAAAIAVQAVRDRGWQPYEPESAILWLRSGEAAKRLALGFDMIVSDVYWIRAVIYYGGRRRVETRRSLRRALSPPRSHDLARSAVQGGVPIRRAVPVGACSWRPRPAGSGDSRCSSAASSRMGTGSTPRTSASSITGGSTTTCAPLSGSGKAATRPGAPSWLTGLAATTLAVGGSRESSRQLWTELLNNSDASIQGQAKHRLLQLDAMDAIDQLSASLQRFKDREGRMPRTWQELVTAERLQGIPVDPAGVPFLVDGVTGRIDVSKQSPLWPLPTEPKAGSR
jgi:hypothetical protein